MRKKECEVVVPSRPFGDCFDGDHCTCWYGRLWQFKRTIQTHCVQLKVVRFIILFDAALGGGAGTESTKG